MLLAIIYWHIAFGAAVIVVSGYTFIRRDQFANGIYRWYQSIPEGHIGPTWFRWQFRPSTAQSKIIATLVAVAGAAVGVVMLATELR
jgi:hypothetical protein